MQYKMLVRAIFSMHVLNSSVGKKPKNLSISQHSEGVDFYVTAMYQCTEPSTLFFPAYVSFGLQGVGDTYFPYLWVKIVYD